MRIPEEVEIGGAVYKVKFTDIYKRTSDDDCGYCDMVQKLIVIDDKMSKQMKESTFLHEVIEAINAEIELGLDHKTICMFESFMYQVIKQI